MLKRGFDFAAALVGLVLLAPVFAFLAIAIRLKLGGPVLFAQRRPGLSGRPFEMLKFRTMTDGRDARGELLPDSMRLTPFGNWLRSTSLDELPELLNVLKGEMSLVGPRPLLMQYLPLYSPEQNRRHEARPGVTGWAQVNGRNALTWPEKFALDTWYVDNRTMLLDIRILLMTVAKVVRREGINAAVNIDDSAFQGNADEGRRR